MQNKLLGLGTNHPHSFRRFIQSQGKGWFTAPEIVEATNVRIQTVALFLLRNLRAGHLIRRGQRGGNNHRSYEYRCLSDLPVRDLAKGEVAIFVWRIMKRAKKPLRDQEIYKRVTKLSKNHVSPSNVHCVVYRWFANGYASRTGRPGKYQLKSGLKERPPVTNPY